MATPILDTGADEHRLAFNKLIAILSSTGAFAPYGTAQARYLLCLQAGVLGPAGAGTVLWQDPAPQVAGIISSRLNAYGFDTLPGRPGFTALGALADHLLTLDEIAPGDRRWLAGLIASYGLVGDPAYLEALCRRYGCVLSPAPGAPPVHLGPGEREIVEKVWNSWDNFLDIEALWGVHYTAQAVARIEVPKGTASGTGFLIGPDLLLTNQHVLPNPTVAATAAACFSYVLDVGGKAVESRMFDLSDPEQFYYSSPEAALDYALVHLKGQPLSDVAIGAGADGLSFRELVLAGKHRGYLRLQPRPILNLERVNIIQHPGGMELKATLTANRVEGEVTKLATRVKYRTDTETGSSGSPVLSGIWEVLALHKGAIELATGGGCNVGVPLLAIVADLKHTAETDHNLSAALQGLQPCFDW